MESLNGVWKFKSSENFDQYMKEIGEFRKTVIKQVII